ncbi:MAG TPA: TonB-dependent receptor [Vicinamibacterales bacterium]|nr:TonB-dependent receptor [Vicinamibacterales bacterium]
MEVRLARPMVLWMAVLILAAFAAPSSAQVSAGRIDATVADSTGAVLPGVTVDITGPQNRSTVTDTLGEAHFLNLAPGTYAVSAKLSGFSDYLNKNVPVATGASVPLRISMAVAGVSTQVQVTSEAPVVDTKKMTTSTNVSVEELQNIPSSRDPWVVMQTVPGIVLDRVNVGGGESGQQPGYQAKGANGADNTWNMDGIAITDMAATGSSSTYYDFDMFQEMQVTTGGADVSNPTPGIQLNMVLKSGSNTPHGSTRIYFENESLESNNMPADLAASIGGKSGKGNRIHQYKDYGFELGGPILKNRLWAWGAAGKTDIQLLTLTGYPDHTILQDTSFKATGQLSPSTRANFTFFRGNKQKFGRGASSTRPPETTYDQKGPTDMYKGEVNFVLGNNIFLVAKGAHIHGGFQLAPEGGLTAHEWFDDSGVQHGTADLYKSNRPQDSVGLDGSVFRGHHELKFGFGWRRAVVQSTDTYPGTGLITVHNGYPEMYAFIKRDWASNDTGIYNSAYASDTWSMNRLTANLGVRWDRQASSLDATTVPGSTVLPSLLPAVSAKALKNAVVWNSVVPRLGLTYAVDEKRKTILRGSYAMFASQLGDGIASQISTIQYTGIYYYAVDLNGNKLADPNEILFNLGPVFYYGFDPSNPASLTTNNKIGKYTTPRTQEVLLGIDHELMANFGVSATFTYRYYNHFDWYPLVGVTRADYSQAGVCTSSAPPCAPANGDTGPVGTFSTPYFGINPAKIPPGLGSSYQARNGYHQRFLGAELSATKRMSDHWMARFGFSTNDHREYFDSPNTSQLDPTSTRDNPNINGGHVITRSGGSGKSNIFLVLPQYQFVANGMYQARWGINLGANWVLRQGYAEPFYRSRVNPGDGLGFRNVLAVTDVTKFRLPAVSSLDVRLEKSVKIQRMNFAVDLDVFNIGNAATVLGRQYDLRLSTTSPTGFNHVLEIMDPRVARVGVRFNF